MAVPDVPMSAVRDARPAADSGPPNRHRHSPGHLSSSRSCQPRRPDRGEWQTQGAPHRRPRWGRPADCPRDHRLPGVLRRVIRPKSAFVGLLATPISIRSTGESARLTNCLPLVAGYNARQQPNLAPPGAGTGDPKQAHRLQSMGFKGRRRQDDARVLSSPSPSANLVGGSRCGVAIRFEGPPFQVPDP